MSGHAVRVWMPIRTASPRGRRKVEQERLTWRELVVRSNLWPRKP